MDNLINDQMEPNQPTVLDPLFSAVFGNPLLLEKIFSHVDTAKDLKSIRQVSTLWRDMSLDQWRKTGTLKLLWKADGPSHCDFCHDPPICDQNHEEDYYGKAMDLPEYLEVLQKSEEEGEDCPYQYWKKPFTRYRIGYCSFLLRSHLIDETLEKFWSTCGAHIKYLNLDHVSIDGSICSDSFREMLSDRLPNLKELAVSVVPDNKEYDPVDFYIEENFTSPWIENHSGKLERLSLGFCKWIGGETRRDFSEFFANWLFHFPNLQNLQVDPQAFYLDALQNVTISGEHIKLKQLTYLSQDGSDLQSVDDLNNYVIVAQPPLKTVRIAVHLVGAGLQRSLKDFLRNCQPTLDHLELKSFPMGIRGRSLSGYLGNVSLPHLTKLYLIGESVINFRAMSEMPNLKTLWIQTNNCLHDWNQRIGEEEKREVKQGKLLWREMNHLHLDYFRFKPNSLKVLGRWMPNLKRVQLNLNKSTRQLVKEIWAEVEVVTGPLNLIV